jgi:hypothetical protein
MRFTYNKTSTFIVAAVVAVYVALSAAPVNSQPVTHWSVLVKIKPRPGGTGKATISLIDGVGTTIVTFSGIVTPYDGLAIGIKGPSRTVTNGDTPFGVYKFVDTAGGTSESQLQPAFGTGKVYLNDSDMFGEVADAGRSLIRLHGGGSSLAKPYALDQPLRATKGCVRMKNRDVNDLIQRLKDLTPQNSVKFIFMGDEAYLNTLATDTALSNKSWWPVLRVVLHSPSGPTELVNNSTSMLVEESAQLVASADPDETPQSNESLIELVKLYAEDVGPKGEQALESLRSQKDQLVSLQNSLPADDPLRPKLAFVLCNLDQDSDANMRVLQTALAEPAQYKGVFADQVQDMISRLIDREDSRGNEETSTSLTRSLIAAAPRADGALSEGIGVTLSKQLRLRSGIFLSAWGEHFAAMEPQESTLLKSRVFGLMRASHRLTAAEIKQIRTYLYSVRDFSEEFEDAVKDYKELYLQPNTNRRRVGPQ